MVQAKKFSLALTERGDMYIWGLKAGFGAPKRLRGSKISDVEVVDVRLGSDKVYGLASDGSLYEWDIFKGAEDQEEWVCNNEKVLPNTRPILGFSSGDGYLLILGDIVKQIEGK
jgi:alpha-tubulin suppressor-like RCC1 family protein